MDAQKVAQGDQFPKMNGKTVFMHAVKRMPEAITEALQAHSLTAADVDLFVLHQANLRICEAAAKQLGLRSITALLTDDPALAYRILALNTEKAHNLRDRALEVIRMARQLAKEAPRSKESEHATSFESPAFLTLGAAYETRARLDRSPYNSLARCVDRLMDQSLPRARRSAALERVPAPRPQNFFGR